ncbi:MAG TPA: hypothetical protein VMJ65_00755 [Solirubrobacteraceae bacterium]|nr:hypothetical protein [Solirubrobacteraceae bacterium]
MRLHGQNGDPSVGLRLARVGLTVGAIAAAVTVAVSTGAVPIPGLSGGSRKTQASEEPALAAQRTLADEQWASATCTSILDWKNEIRRDGTSLNLGLGLGTRIHDAVTATTRLVNQLDKLGLPPGAQTSQARAELNQLRSDVASRLKALEGTASSVAGGNIAAIGSLLADLENAKVLGTQITSELRHVVSVDLGLSLAETRACRQLVGIPI